MNPERLFLDGSRPYVTELAALLLGRHAIRTVSGPRVDLGQVMVILPGARSGRRLLDRLEQAATERGLPWIPPRILTPGIALEALRAAREPEGTSSARPLAGTLERRSAWSGAIARLPLGDREQLGLGEESALGRWLLAGVLDELHRELSGEALSIAQAADRLPGRRLSIAARAAERYREILEQHDRRDPADERRLGLQLPAPQRAGPIYLMGLFDLPILLRRYLLAEPVSVTALVCGPEAQADRYDELGVARPDDWARMPLPLSDDTILFARDSESQAARTVDQIAAWTEARGGLAREDVSIGVIEAASATAIARLLGERGVPTRLAAGRPFSGCGPARLLAGLRALAHQPDYEAVSALARHPDVERWWSHIDEATLSPERLLTLLDRFRREHLPSGWTPGSPIGVELAAPFARLDDLLRPLLGPGSERRPLAAWAEPLRSVLTRLYASRQLDEASPRDRETTEALGAIRDVLDEVSDLDPKLAPIVNAADALAIVNEALADAVLSDPGREPAIELLGWLELLLDDAAYTIVTSANEPGLPATPAHDPFLPEPARRALGLNDHARRYARDAAIATALEQSARSTGDLRWIATRIDADRRPALPSRLLLAADAETVARRIHRFSGTSEDADEEKKANDDATATVATSSPAPRRFDLPRPVSPPALERLRVTAFRDYLACPYRFYLRHVLRLDAVDDRPSELDAAAFGTLVHEVLRRFGRQESVRDSIDPSAITEYLHSALARVARDRYGKNPLPAVRIQLAGARQRLAAFADWQVGWRRQGYRIREAELPSPESGVALAVDGVPFFLTGTIDRIDEHEESGDIVLLDYKTSESGGEPDRVHRKREFVPNPAKPGKRMVAKTWVDLQLPLYRHLAEARGYRPAVEMGYITLPRALRGVGFSPAGWSESELADADAVARAVVRSLREREFWPPAERPPAFSEVYSPICQDGLLIEGADEILNAVESENGDGR